ncbi:MAG: nucleoside-diphosphate kinase [Planctomycetota bacterium]|nr:MAG: nucleoside-diphosphate kinase [Planctomycetota bacterium]
MARERSLVLFKPDAVQRRLCGRLLTRIEEKGLKVVGMKMLRLTSEMARAHYREHVQKPFYPALEAFITSAPVIALVVEGPGAVEVMRRLMGPTNGREAPPGTLRGDFGLSRQMNLIHGSDSVESARREIEIYFQPHEIFEYESVLDGNIALPDE